MIFTQNEAIQYSAYYLFIYGMFNDNVSSTDCKHFDCDPTWGTTPAFSWRDYGKPQDTSVTVARVQAIWILRCFKHEAGVTPT
jgi:hypothetical protein